MRRNAEKQKKLEKKIRKKQRKKEKAEIQLEEQGITPEMAAMGFNFSFGGSSKSR